jgi:hypothetical protein
MAAYDIQWARSLVTDIPTSSTVSGSPGFLTDPKAGRWESGSRAASIGLPGSIGVRGFSGARMVARQSGAGKSMSSMRCLCRQRRAAPSKT